MELAINGAHLNNDFDIKAYDATLKEIELPLLTAEDHIDEEQDDDKETNPEKKNELAKARQERQEEISA